MKTAGKGAISVHAFLRTLRKSWALLACFAILVGTANGQQNEADPLPPKLEAENAEPADALHPAVVVDKKPGSRASKWNSLAKPRDRKFDVGLAVFAETLVGHTLIGDVLAAVWTDRFQNVITVIGVMIRVCLSVAESAAPHPEAVPVSIEKMKKASSAIAAIAGIAILGAGVIAFTMIWARRLRRLARDPGPRQTTLGNDFWFLKPRKVIPAKSKLDGKSTPSPPETPE